ncbi:hypothetical protein QUF70_10800 [Desulfobacterales bacterium HSG17]|nr:hypothetical protein [Desulfobacterales bacterium HSG17]
MPSFWPESKINLDQQTSEIFWNNIKNEVFRICRHNQLPSDFSTIVKEVYLPLAAWINGKSQDKEGTVVLGINGAQGSGKSTLCRFLEFLLLEIWTIRAVTISIDDLYKTRSQRKYLAKIVHPLFETRGVPGAHDVNLGLKLFQDLKNMKKGSEPVSIPRFNKALDDRYPESQWTLCTQVPKVILFEGWCVGACPQLSQDLEIPVNCLEREKDSEFVWRKYVNSQLEKVYPPLFNQIDYLVMLKIPGIKQVLKWRKKQEHKLAQSRKSNRGNNRIMTDEEIEEFVMHYQRLTEYMLEEMPQRANIILWLNETHQIYKITHS